MLHACLQHRHGLRHDAASTTTTTTTTIPTLFCGPDTCGGGTCDKTGPPGPVKRAPPEDGPGPARDTQPALNTWADPANYGGDRSKFVRGGNSFPHIFCCSVPRRHIWVLVLYNHNSLSSGRLVVSSSHEKLWSMFSVATPSACIETYLAYRQRQSRVTHSYDELGVGTSISTYNYVTFGNQVQTLAVKGLYGCTSVVVVSRKGAWASLFWEDPSFLGTADDADVDFNFDVLMNLEEGSGSEDARFINQYGVGQLRKRDIPGKGDLGHMFDDIHQPRVFIMAPRPEVNLPNDQPDNSESAGGSRLRFPEQMKKIKDKLANIFQGLNVDDIETIQYSPMTMSLGVLGFRKDGTVVGDYGDKYYVTHRGKLLIQYQPAPHVCQANPYPGQAKWRVTFENRGRF